jgi:hypothetical protein
MRADVGGAGCVSPLVLPLAEAMEDQQHIRAALPQQQQCYLANLTKVRR